MSKRTTTPLRAMASRESKADRRAVMRASEELHEALREDGWQNPYTGLGDPDRDPSSTTQFIGRTRLSYTVLDRLYTQNPIANRVINRPAFDATRAWLTLKSDNEITPELEKAITDDVKRLRLKFEVRKLISYARAYGSAVMLIAADDGQKLDKPLRLDKVKKFSHVQVFDRWQAQAERPNPDLASPDYGKPEFYTLYSVTGSTSRRVHYSRLVRLDGVQAPERMQYENEGWGFSVLDQTLPEIRSFSASYRYVESIVKDFTQDVFQINNLQTLLGGRQADQVKERFRLIRLSKSMLNAVIIGKEEMYEKKTSSVAGLDKILDSFQFLLSAATGIPITFLFGRSPAGMNATGESDITNYYDQISSYQEDQLDPVVARLIAVVLAAKEGPAKGTAPPITHEWNPLWQMSDKENAEIYQMTAKGDKDYVDAGILLPEEVANSRFGGEEGPITLDEKLREEHAAMQELLDEAALAAAENGGADPDQGPGAPKNKPGAKKPPAKEKNRESNRSKPG